MSAQVALVPYVVNTGVDGRIDDIRLHLCIIPLSPPGKYISGWKGNVKPFTQLLDDGLTVVAVEKEVFWALLFSSTDIAVVEELVNDEEVNAVEEATPEQVEQARDVRNKLKLHRIAKQLAQEQAFMLKQWPMTMLVELLPRIDLPKAIEIQREHAEAGLIGAYESLTKTKEFKDFKNVMEYGMKVNKSISDDREIEAKELMRNCRLCLIKEIEDLELVATNGMACTLVIGSNLGEVAETAKHNGMKYLVHHEKAENPMGNGESKVMKVAVWDVVEKSSSSSSNSNSNRRDDGQTKRRKMG